MGVLHIIVVGGGSRRSVAGMRARERESACCMRGGVGGPWSHSPETEGACIY